MSPPRWTLNFGIWPLPSARMPRPREVFLAHSPEDLAARYRRRHTPRRGADRPARRSWTATATAPWRRLTSACRGGPRARPYSRHDLQLPARGRPRTGARPAVCPGGGPCRGTGSVTWWSGPGPGAVSVPAQVELCLRRARQFAGLRELPKFYIVLALAEMRRQLLHSRRRTRQGRLDRRRGRCLLPGIRRDPGWPARR